jgi:hypothetical protein
LRRFDRGLEALLNLDGYIFVVDEKSGYWVKFVVKRVPPSPAKPQGLDYSLTLHGPLGDRLVGFDNAHPVPKSRQGRPQDHRHRFDRILSYEYHDAVGLLETFWMEVYAVLRGKGSHEDT